MVINQNVFFIIFSIFVIKSECNSKKKVVNQIKELKLNIPNYSPIQDDDYVAVSYKAVPGYIIMFEPLANADQVHHMILYGCTTPAQNKKFWRGLEVCGYGVFHIIYAWARNAPSLKLPPDVGFAIGSENDSVQYLVLQVHYAHPFKGKVHDFSGLIVHLTEKRPKYLANVFLLVSSEEIPPHQSSFLTYVSCTYNFNVDLYPFAFRTHTHAMGRIVSGYIKQKNLENGTDKWIKIGKRNPLWPQIFELIEDKSIVIRKNDLIASVCRFDSSKKNTSTSMGSMNRNEMCNFYMMYYRKADDPEPFEYSAICGSNENPELLNAEYPKEGVSLFPNDSNSEIDESHSAFAFGVLEKGRFDKIENLQLGQIAGLSFNNENQIVIFHRADRIWDSNTFNDNKILNNKSLIKKPTIIVADFDEITNNMKLLHSYGESIFYMPHGLFIDENNNYYTTDVGSHQVIKWEIKNGKLSSIWKLGEEFVPGNDNKHFCQPSSVAVSQLDKSVYVVDGYCNSRVVKFSENGIFIMEWGESSYNTKFGYEYFTNYNLGYFFLPHDITIDNSKHQIFVADRENGRVQVFNEEGNALYDIKNSNLYKTVYSVSFSKKHGLLLLPGYSSNLPDNYELNIFVVSNNLKNIQFSFGPTSGNFKKPHIVRINDNIVYVGEIQNYNGTLWRFEIQTKQSKTNMSKTTNISKSLKKVVKNNYEAKGNFWSTIFLALISISAFYGFCYYFWCISEKNFSFLNFICCWKKNLSSQNNIDRKGFQPLRNLDDDDEDKSDSNDDIFFDKKTLSLSVK